MKNHLKIFWDNIISKNSMHWKYKTTFPSHTNNQEDDATQDGPRKLLYSYIIRHKPSESSIIKKSNEIQVPTKPIGIIQKLRTLNTKRRGKSPIRSKSNTKQNKDEQLKAQIEQLKQEVKVLKTTIKLKKKTHLHLSKLPNKIKKTCKCPPIHKEANNEIWKLFN